MPQGNRRLSRLSATGGLITLDVGLIDHNAAAPADAANAVVPERRLSAELINQAHGNTKLRRSLPWSQHKSSGSCSEG